MSAACLSKGVLSVTRQARSVKKPTTPRRPRANPARGATAKPDAEQAAEGKAQEGASTKKAEGSRERRPLVQTEQLGATLAKGLDLAEASLSLGLTLMSRFGSMVQESVLEKVADHFPAAAGPAQAPGAPEQTEPAPSPAAAQPASESREVPESDVGFSITNRLPLFPGHAVSVSFSLNNDSEEIAKRVKLRVEGFVGQLSAAKIPSDGFSVKPSSGSIAPMDFEKFVLKGTLPSDIPSDVYLGKVIVLADHNLEIPVRLVVGPPTP